MQQFGHGFSCGVWGPARARLARCHRSSPGAVSGDPSLSGAIAGYIPEVGAQEGVVYTVLKTDGGVAVRAEVAAQTAEASCPVLPNGGVYGAPGQG